jgi:hypothetical protein
MQLPHRSRSMIKEAIKYLSRPRCKKLKLNSKKKITLPVLGTGRSNFGWCCFFDDTMWLESAFFFNEKEYTRDWLTVAASGSPTIGAPSSGRGDLCSPRSRAATSLASCNSADMASPGTFLGSWSQRLIFHVLQRTYHTETIWRH